MDYQPLLFIKRTDLLPLVANLVDGEDQENGGERLDCRGIFGF